MRMQKKDVSDGIAYARKEPYKWDEKQFEADIKNGDTIKILDEGTLESGQYGEDTVFRIDTRNGEKKTRFNQKSINVLIDAFGDDSKDWVGKEVKVLTKKDTIANRRVVVAYFVTDGYILDEYGELVKEGEGLDENGNPFDNSDLPF